MLNQYRTNPDFIPELDLVMEEDGRIIGHVMFSKAEIILDERQRVGETSAKRLSTNGAQECSGIGTHFPSWTFGPISIHPDYKRKGYGLKLLNYAKGYFVADEHPEAFETYEATFPKKVKLRLPGQLGYEE